MASRRRRFGLGARLALAFTLLAVLTAFVTAGVSANSTSRQVNGDIDRFLKDRSLDIAEGRRVDVPRQGGNRPGRNNNGLLPSPPAGGTTIEVIDEIRSLVESDAEVQLLSEDGNVLVTAGVVLPFEASDATFLVRFEPVLLRTVEVGGEEYRMITRHVEGGGAVQVAQSLSTTNALLGDLRSELLLVGVIMSGLAALLGWGIAQTTTRPLRKLTRTIETVAATEDLSTPVLLDRSDEIGRLSEEFDSLLKTLGSSRDQQQRLVQDAAHELRTPLTSVRANIDFLGMAPDLDEEQRRTTLISIKTELGELSAVLAEVVELATESRGVASFEELDLAGVAEVALAQFELRSARPVVRKLTPCLVAGDHGALVRAAQNLIGNADKYSPEGLPITVSVLNGSLFVSDEGPGIDAGDGDRIFDRFYRSDRDRSAPGSGLGLAIVAKAAAEHEGKVWAREASGGGAEVGFTVPVI
jgi:two-component system sensor histidine kinase MprB